MILEKCERFWDVILVLVFLVVTLTGIFSFVELMRM